MGLFVLDLSEEQSIETKIQTAISNIKLHTEHFDINNSNYLLTDFALPYLEEALKLLIAKNKLNE